MGEPHRGFFFVPSYYIPGYERQPLEYPGFIYNLERSSDPEYNQHEEGSFDDPQDVPSEHNEDSHQGSAAQLAWPTEIPVQLKVAICCEEWKKNLESTLRSVQGVHDVGIEGWSNAKVTVTGTASARKILEAARSIFREAKPWSNSDFIDEYSSELLYRRWH